MRIGTVQQKEICDKVVQNVQCPKCNSRIHALLMRSVLTGYMFFAPFVKRTYRYYSICPNCRMEYNISKVAYKSLLLEENTAELFYTICAENLSARQNFAKARKDRSPKELWIAAILAFLGGLFGLQNWYMGHKKRGLIAIVLWVVSIIFFAIGFVVPPILVVCAIPLAINVYWGLIDFVRIILGRAKDSNGRYIMTPTQHQKRTQIL